MTLPAPETELQMAQRHVERGEQLILKQEGIVDRLRSQGHSLDEAAALLATLRHTLQLSREHVTRLEAEAVSNTPADQPARLDHELPPRAEGDGENYSS